MCSIQFEVVYASRDVVLFLRASSGPSILCAECIRNMAFSVLAGSMLVWLKLTRILAIVAVFEFLVYDPWMSPVAFYDSGWEIWILRIQLERIFANSLCPVIRFAK